MSTLLTPTPSLGVNQPRDLLLALQRESKHLQEALQSLLDAQSLGLSIGLGHTTSARPKRPRSKTHQPNLSSRSPQHGQSPHSSPSRSRSRVSEESLSLSSARSGIYTTLLALAQNKRSEIETYVSSESSYERFIATTSHLEKKRSVLESEIQRLVEGPEQEQVTSLKEEENGLLIEIRALEDELAVKNARLRDVKIRREQAANRHEANLSSWRSALEEVEHSIKEEVLTGREVRDELRTQNEAEVVWSLPDHRRTITLVREGVDKELRSLQEKRGAAEAEQMACIEGADCWKACVREAGRVEKSLRVEMQRLKGESKMKQRRGSIGSNSIHGSTPDLDGEVEAGIQGVLRQMDSAIETSHKLLQNAVEQRWNPVACAIGAELEALKEGQEVLQQAFGFPIMEPEPSEAVENMRDGDGEMIHGSKNTLEDSDNIRIVHASHEDDEPSSDMLFSHTDDE